MWMLIRLICARENTLHVNSATHYLVIRLDLLLVYPDVQKCLVLYKTFHPHSSNTRTVWIIVILLFYVLDNLWLSSPSIHIGGAGIQIPDLILQVRTSLPSIM